MIIVASLPYTGHLIGDTGDFGNTQYTGFPVVAAGGTVTPFIQNNQVLAELNRHHGGNFVAERSLMAGRAREGLSHGGARQGRAGRHP